MFNRLTSILALSATVATASAHMPGPVALAFETETKPLQIENQIIVKIKPGKEKAVASAYAKAGMKMVTSIPRIGWQVLRLPAGTTVVMATAKLKSISGVVNTQPNYIVHAHDVKVNDPRFGEQYSLTRMKVPAAWDISTSDSGTVVAVLDTGVDYTHPDLVNKVVKGYDFYENDTDPMDVEGHGTHVAGSVAAETNNGVGVAGVGYNTTILAVRVLGPGGGSSATVASGIVWAADNGANIINMSLGGGGFGQAEVDAVDYANDTKNVLVMASAGNSGLEGNPRSYPAYFTKVVAVGASDSNDGQADFSEFNPINGSDNWVDIAAPGVEVLSTVRGGGYESAGWSGTSMACPNAAGVASLIWSTLSATGETPKNSDVRKLLEENCDPIGTWINYGRVNAFASLSAIGTPVVVDAGATAPEALDGATFPKGNDPISLTATDSISLTVQSKRKSGVGLTGAFATNFAMTGITTDQLRSATLNFAVSGDRKATIQLFLWDNLNGKWALYTARPAPVSQTNLAFNLSKTTLMKYLSNNQIRLMVRSLVPTSMTSGAKGLTTVDRLSVTYKGVRGFGAGQP